MKVSCILKHVAEKRNGEIGHSFHCKIHALLFIYSNVRMAVA